MSRANGEKCSCQSKRCCGGEPHGRKLHDHFPNLESLLGGQGYSRLRFGEFARSRACGQHTSSNWRASLVRRRGDALMQRGAEGLHRLCTCAIRRWAFWRGSGCRSAGNACGGLRVSDRGCRFRQGCSSHRFVAPVTRFTPGFRTTPKLHGWRSAEAVARAVGCPCPASSRATGGIIPGRIRPGASTRPCCPILS